jgi:hypothetical protein
LVAADLKLRGAQTGDNRFTGAVEFAGDNEAFESLIGASLPGGDGKAVSGGTSSAKVLAQVKPAVRTKRERGNRKFIVRAC